MILALGALVPPPRLADGSDPALTGREGHPRASLPLGLWVQPFGDASLDAAAGRAVGDWNAVAGEVLGVEVFTPVAQERAQVRVRVERSLAAGAMGVTHLSTDERGIIQAPVTIEVAEPVARGQTSRETILYQVLAHELGHALGLPHVTDPRSLMCCEPGTVDLADPATRAAYVEARRRPGVSSVRAELSAHYAGVWGR